MLVHKFLPNFPGAKNCFGSVDAGLENQHVGQKVVATISSTFLGFGVLWNVRTESS